MDTSKLVQRSETAWEVSAQGAMRVPAIIFASPTLIAEMDDKVREQICNVAMLPGASGAGADNARLRRPH